MSLKGIGISIISSILAVVMFLVVVPLALMYLCGLAAYDALWRTKNRLWR